MTTSRELFLAACRRESTDRSPAWMMRQAGRSLPEYRQARSGHTFMQMVHDPALSAEVTLQPIRRFGMDAAVVFCDILVPAEAMGVGVELIEKKGPVLTPPVRTRGDVERLQTFDPLEKTGFLAETLRLVRQELTEERALIGFCGAPWTLASYMIEGASSRNFENTKRMMLGDPETFDALLTKIVDVSIPYLKMQLDAGADVVQVFDSWGGAIDADTYRRVLLPHVARLVAGAKETGAPVILYVNGCSHLLEVLVDAAPDVLGIDWRVDPREASERVGERVALQGNLDPCALFAPPEVVRQEAGRVLDAFREQRTRGHIFNLGSGILPPTPLDSIAAMWETVLPR